MFVSTAALGNISRASEVLHISQPGLTRALQEFESQLGVALFHRTTRRLLLTHEGGQFLPIAQRLLLDMQQAVQDVQAQKSGLRGAVTVAVGAAFGSAVLPSTLELFSRTHPDVRLKIVEEASSGDITARAARAQVDLGIGSLVGDTTGLTCHKLLTAPLGLLGDAEKFPDLLGSTSKALASVKLFKESANTGIAHLLHSHGASLLSRMEHGLEVSSLVLQVAFAHAGLGVAVVSALGASHPHAHGLHFAPLRPSVLREVFLFYRSDRSLSPSARALANCLGLALKRCKLHTGVKIAFKTPAIPGG